MSGPGPVRPEAAPARRRARAVRDAAGTRDATHVGGASGPANRRRGPPGGVGGAAP